MKTGREILHYLEDEKDFFTELLREHQENAADRLEDDDTIGAKIELDWVAVYEDRIKLADKFIEWIRRK